MGLYVCSSGGSYRAIGMYGGMVFLSRVVGRMSASMLSMWSLFSEPIQPLQNHSKTWTHTHTHTRTRTHMCKNTHTQAHARRHTHTHTHMCKNTQMQAHARRHTHTHTHTRAKRHTHASARTHTHTHTHTCKNTHDMRNIQGTSGTFMFQYPNIFPISNANGM